MSHRFIFEQSSGKTQVIAISMFGGLLLMNMSQSYKEDEYTDVIFPKRYFPEGNWEFIQGSLDNPRMVIKLGFA